MSEAPSSSSPQPPASSSPPPAASQAFIVGKSFLKQYYEVLATTPENISRFYKPDTSIISHSFQPSVPAEPKVLGATGHEVFQWAAACSDGSGISIDFGSGAIDAQETIAGGILLVVTGQMTLPQGDVDANNADANTPRPFVHTFFLNVALAGKRKNYYVHNDILRFISTPDGSQQQQQQQQQEQQQEDVPVEKNSVEEVNDNTSPPPPPQDKPVESEAKPVSTTAVAPPVAQAQKVQIAEEKKDVIQGEKEEKAKEVVVVKDVATSKVESKNERKKASADKGKKKEKDTTSKSDKKSSESGSGNGGKDEKKSKKGKARSRSSKKGSRSASPTEGKNGNDNNDGKPKPPGSWASLVAGSGGTANPSPAAAAAASVASQMTESSKGQATASASASASVSTAKEEKRSTTSTTTDNNPSTSASNGKESKTTKAVNGSTSTITQRTPEATLLLKNVSDRTKEHEIRSMFEPYAAKVSQNILGITLKASSGFCFVDFDAKFVVDTILKEVEELKKSGVGNKFAMHGKPMDVGRKVPVEKGGGRGHNYRSSSPGHSTFPKPRHHRRNSPRGQREGNRSGRQHANQDKK